METLDDVLEHFGIRGMKWGVRRKSPGGSSSPRPVSSDAVQTHAIKKNINRHGLSAASNAELKLLNERVGLEKKYHELFPKQQGIADKGKKLALDILEPVFKQQAKAYLTQYSTKKLGLKAVAEVGKHSRPA